MHEMLPMEGDKRPRRGTKFAITARPVSEKREEAMRASNRARLILGRHVKETISGVESGGIAYYEPSAYDSQYENTLVYGPSGSGKTWVGYSLMAQSFFAEQRTWIVVDTKSSFQGTWRPNVGQMEEIFSHGICPMGIPASQVDIIAPEYFMKMVPVDKIRESRITDSYKIPLVMCGLALMFELTKLSKGASYAATFEVKFNELLIQTQNKPTVAAFEKMINDLVSDPKFPKQLMWVFNMMLQKIKEIAGFTIDEQNQWSSVGRALFRAARENKPRIIYFTLKDAKTPQDDVNLALLTAVLTEVKVFAEHARHAGLNVRLGVLIDELHTFVRVKDSTSVQMIHDLIFAWGRTSKIWRIYMTQKQEQLPKTFRDSIDELKSQGTFQNIISCQAVPEPGYGKMLDRLHARDDGSTTDDTPRFYPKVKFMPPICEVESDIPDNETWKVYWARKLSGMNPRSTGENVSWNDVGFDLAMRQRASVIPRHIPPPGTGAASGKFLRASPVMLPSVQVIWDNVRRVVSGPAPGSGT